MQLIQSEQVSSKQWDLTPEGKEVIEKGSHEALVYYAVPSSGISQAELMVRNYLSETMQAVTLLLLCNTVDTLNRVLEKNSQCQDWIQ